jgi:hypothetical protein
LDATAVSVDAAIAADVAVVISQQFEDVEDASSLTLWAGIIFLEH